MGHAGAVADGDEQRTVAASVLDVARGEAGVRAHRRVEHGLDAARAAVGAAWMAPFLVELLDDDYSAIRYTAIRSLRAIPGFADLAYDYVGTEESRWAAQREARALVARAQPAARAELLFDGDGRFARGEFERLAAERDEDDQMFLAE